MNDEIVISVSHLTKDYGFGRGVFDVTFDVHKGECFGYLGPNGAGKSTTIRHILGFSRPTKGTITVFGRDSFKDSEDILGHLGYLPDEIALPAGLSGRAFLMMEEKLRGGNGTPPRLIELLKTFALNPDMDPKMMSLGDKRKLAVVAAFMDDPEVLVLDEPTSGLDPLMQRKFVDFIIQEKKRGKTILLSSHLFPEVDATCDTIAIIKDGHHVSTFKANDFKYPNIIVYLVKLGSTEEEEALLQEPLKVTRGDNGWIKVEADISKTNGVLAVLSKYHVLDLKEELFSLESYFMSFYKEKKTFGGLKGIENTEGEKK